MSYCPCEATSKFIRQYLDRLKIGEEKEGEEDGKLGRISESLFTCFIYHIKRNSKLFEYIRKVEKVLDIREALKRSLYIQEQHFKKWTNYESGDPKFLESRFLYSRMDPGIQYFLREKGIPTLQQVLGFILIKTYKSKSPSIEWSTIDEEFLSKIEVV